MQFVRNILFSFKKYGYLINQLVSRDFKVKYKRSFLGIGWSLLYPLLTTAVMAVVFKNVFRFTTPGISFIAYLMTGLTYFNYFSEASNLAMSSVVANFSLGRRAIPKLGNGERLQTVSESILQQLGCAAVASATRR